MATTYEGTYSLTSASAAFKRKYGQGGIEVYQAATPLLSQIRKEFNHTGTNFNDHLLLSQGGGFGAGTLPTASNPQQAAVQFARKKMYYRARVDREAIYASKDMGAFLDTMKFQASQGPKTFARFVSMCLFLERELSSTTLIGSGKIGAISGSPTGSNPYVCTLGTAGDTKNFHVGDIVNIETGNTDRFEVQAVNSTGGTVTVYRTSGSQVPANTDEIYIQGSEDGTIQSLEGLLTLASGEDVYGVSHGQGFEPGINKNASSAAISWDLLAEAALEIEKKSGVGPDLLVLSYKQWRKLAGVVEQRQQQEVMLKPVDKISANIGISAIRLTLPTGPCDVIREKHAPDNTAYLLNRKYIKLKHSGGFGWFDDDGTIFLREADSDSYEARFGGYMELFAIPTFHGRIHTLA